MFLVWEGVKNVLIELHIRISAESNAVKLSAVKAVGYSLAPPLDCEWNGVGYKPYDARALTVLTVWQEVEGKSEKGIHSGS